MATTNAHGSVACMADLEGFAELDGAEAEKPAASASVPPAGAKRRKKATVSHPRNGSGWRTEEARLAVLHQRKFQQKFRKVKRLPKVLRPQPAAGAWACHHCRYRTGRKLREPAHTAGLRKPAPVRLRRKAIHA